MIYSSLAFEGISPVCFHPNRYAFLICLAPVSIKMSLCFLHKPGMKLEVCLGGVPDVGQARVKAQQVFVAKKAEAYLDNGESVRVSPRQEAQPVFSSITFLGVSCLLGEGRGVPGQHALRLTASWLSLLAACPPAR